MTLYQAIFLLIIFLLFVTILAAIFYKGERAERVRIYLSALRTGVREKGLTGPSLDGIWVHTFCWTQIRIGIHRKEKIPVQYCWRCEQILSRIDPAKPGAGRPPEGDPNRKIINLSDHRK